MPLFGPPNVEKLKAKQDVKGLIKALGYQKSASVRDAATGALVKIGTPAVEPLISALKDDKRDVRRAVVEALGKIGDAQAVEPLISGLKDDERDVSRAIVEALGKIGDTRAIEPLIIAAHKSYDMSHWVVDALAKIGAPAVEPLIAKLKDRNCIEALGKIGDARAVDPLIAALKDDVHRIDAAIALGKIGAPAVEPLIAALKDRNVRNWAIKALVYMGAPAVEPLIATLKDSDVLEWVIESLAKIGTPAIGPLIATLKEGNVREWVIVTLVKIGTPAVDPLTAALENSDKDVVRWVVEALDNVEAAQPRDKTALTDTEQMVLTCRSENEARQLVTNDSYLMGVLLSMNCKKFWEALTSRGYSYKVFHNNETGEYSVTLTLKK